MLADPQLQLSGDPVVMESDQINLPVDVATQMRCQQSDETRADAQRLEALTLKTVLRASPASTFPP
jgi:hypothetical protein